jgi:hypothetical protein
LRGNLCFLFPDSEKSGESGDAGETLGSARCTISRLTFFLKMFALKALFPDIKLVSFDAISVAVAATSILVNISGSSSSFSLLLESPSELIGRVPVTLEELLKDLIFLNPDLVVLLVLSVRVVDALDEGYDLLECFNFSLTIKLTFESASKFPKPSSD